MNSKILKVAAINSGIFILFLLLIELASYLALLRAGRNNIFFLFAPKPAEVDNPCLRMRTHPFLGHAHDHQNNCNDIAGGSSDGPFVVYDSPQETNDIIITLGGSTTDGFDTYHSQGITWSSSLNEILIDKGIQLKVYNGGVGAYGSSNELLKLLTIAPILDKNPKYIISLNGINDLHAYRFGALGGKGVPHTLASTFPFWTGVHFRSTVLETYISQHKSPFLLFPATQRALNFLSNKNHLRRYSLENDWANSLTVKDQKKFTAAALWKYNIETMNAISKVMGAKYYVFLQPTMGLEKIQIPTDKNSSDYSIYKTQIPKGYIEKINSHYEDLRQVCKIFDYCIDLSGTAPPVGDNYADPRHHNAKGNKLIAKDIFDKIFQNQ